MSLYCTHVTYGLFHAMPIIYIFFHDGEWSGGAKVLGKHSVPGRPTNLDKVRARAYCAAVGAGGAPLSGRRPGID